MRNPLLGEARDIFCRVPFNCLKNAVSRALKDGNRTRVAHARASVRPSLLRQFALPVKYKGARRVRGNVGRCGGMKRGIVDKT